MWLTVKGKKIKHYWNPPKFTETWYAICGSPFHGYLRTELSQRGKIRCKKCMKMDWAKE